MTDEHDSNAMPHVFLVLVDETEDMKAALRYACRRAASIGGTVALLATIKPPEFQHWLGVGQLMEEEHRAEAEAVLLKYAGQVLAISGRRPSLYLKEGRPLDGLLELVNEDPSISFIVLGTAPGRPTPNPLFSRFLALMDQGLRIPITLVPGDLTNEQIDRLA